MAYVEEALDFMEQTFYRRDETNWETLRELALAVVENDPSRDGAHEAVEFATRALDTPHTWFVPPGADEDQPVTEREPPSGKHLDGRVGYLSLPGNVGGTEVTEEYARQVRQIMEELDGENPVCGWILDLRESIGGSSIGDWLALGPLVGDPLLMRAGRSTGEPTSVFYEQGRVRYEGENLENGEQIRDERLPPDAFIPDRLDVPVGVLISSRTASAGEAVAVTFVGRPHTRFFGEVTAGITTSYETLEMPDGGILRVASGLYQDRTGQTHENGVHPDEPIPTAADGQDAVLGSAHDWIVAQPPCT